MLTLAHWYGEELSVQMSVQVPAPAGERWILTLATPEPAPSPAVASSVIVPFRYWPGSVIVTVGAVLSTIAPEYTVELAVLPALSVATERKSY